MTAGTSIANPARTRPLVKVGMPMVRTNNWATSAAALVHR